MLLRVPIELKLEVLMGDFVEQNMDILFKDKNQKNIKKAIKLDKDRLLKEKTSSDNLKIWRDKRLYHLEKEYAGDLNQVFREHSITIGQFDNLYSLADVRRVYLNQTSGNLKRLASASRMTKRRLSRKTPH